MKTEIQNQNSSQILLTGSSSNAQQATFSSSPFGYNQVISQSQQGEQQLTLLYKSSNQLFQNQNFQINIPSDFNNQQLYDSKMIDINLQQNENKSSVYQESQHDQNLQEIETRCQNIIKLNILNEYSQSEESKMPNLSQPIQGQQNQENQGNNQNQNNVSPIQTASFNDSNTSNNTLNSIAPQFAQLNVEQIKEYSNEFLNTLNENQ
ncbi:hypothetical protein ABPG72_022825 [Tetrahymena utriculariae]